MVGREATTPPRRYAVADDLTATPQAMAHQIGIMLGREGIHRHRRRDAMLLQNIEDAEHADPMTVFAMAQAGVIREGP